MNKKRLKISYKWLCVFALLAFVATMLSPLVSAVSAEDQAVQQTIKINQKVEGNPEKTSYLYAVIQTNGPDIGKNIRDRSFRLTGNDEFETVMVFEEPGMFEFTVGRVRNESKGIGDITMDDLYKDDNVIPIKHPFGYKVTENDDGSLTVLPYTCYDNHVEFLKDGTGIVLNNLIKGSVEPTATPTPSITPTQTSKPSSSPSPSDNGKGQYSPKTGDEFHMTLWICVAGVSILFILILLVLGRKKKKDETS